MSIKVGNLYISKYPTLSLTFFIPEEETKGRFANGFLIVVESTNNSVELSKALVDPRFTIKSLYNLAESIDAYNKLFGSIFTASKFIRKDGG